MQSSLFEQDHKPLWSKLTPVNWDDYTDSSNLLNLRERFNKKPFSFLLKGDSGCGKTTFINLLLHETTLPNYKLAATSVSLEEIKKIISKVQSPIILFLDEFHRFSKARQDFFLKPIEEGKIILLAATTESPKYYFTSPLLSRLYLQYITTPNKNVYKEIILKGIEMSKLKISSKVDIQKIIQFCYPDFRRAYNAIEYIFNISPEISSTDEALDKYFSQNAISANANVTSEKFNLLSALMKSIRGSSADASVLYLAKLLAIDTDPTVIARRLVISASEDIGLANSQAAILASSILNSVEKTGMPEARILLSHLCIYLAVSPKSNSCYMALEAASKLSTQNWQPPSHILNNHPDSKNYKYPHNYDGFIKQDYWPKNLDKKELYLPNKNSKFQNSMELKIIEAMEKINL